MDATNHPPDHPGPEPLKDVDPIPVRVRFERRETGSRWQPLQWRLAAVEPGEDASGLEIRVYRDEAEGYYLNVSTDDPSIFVMWRLEEDVPRALQITLSYDEAGRWMDGGEAVDRVPMPPGMARWLSEYVQLHYRPESGRKRRGAKPSFMRPDEFAGMVEQERRAGEQRARDGAPRAGDTGRVPRREDGR